MACEVTCHPSSGIHAELGKANLFKVTWPTQEAWLLPEKELEGTEPEPSEGQEHRNSAAGLALFLSRGLKGFSLISSQTSAKNLGSAPQGQWERWGYKATDPYSCLTLQLNGPEEAPAYGRMEKPTCSWPVRLERRLPICPLSPSWTCYSLGNSPLQPHGVYSVLTPAWVLFSSGW